MKNLLIAFAILVSGVTSTLASVHIYNKNYEAKFTEQVVKLMTKPKPVEREVARVISAGSSNFVSVDTSVGKVLVSLSPLMTDLGANSRIVVKMLNLSSVTYINTSVTFEVGVKVRDGTLQWSQGTFSATFPRAVAGEWAATTLDIQNISVKEISVLYIKSADVPVINAVL